MAENVAQPVEMPVPLQLFGGLVTEMSPSDLPEGISPDCQDVVFLPGSVASRPAAQRWMSLPPNTTVTYQKTFVTTQGVQKNLFLTSDGSLWSQDLSTLVLTRLLTVSPGSYASSISAFGKELICFHNNSQGTDIPRIYDGTTITRATKWGPAGPPTVSNTVIGPSTMSATGALGPVAITTIQTTDPVTYGYPYPHQYYSTITINCASTTGLTLGLGVTISANSNGVFNTTVYVTQIIDNNNFKAGFYSTTFQSGNSGSFTSPSGETAVRTNNLVRITTTTPHGLSVGFQVQIAGLPNQSVGGGISSIVINNETNNGIATITTASAHGLLPENSVSITGVSNTAVGNISAIARSAQLVTVTTTTAHNLLPGAVVLIAGVTDNTYNGQFTVLSTPSTTTFTYAQVDSDSTSTSGTVAIVWPVTNNSIIQNYFTVISVPTLTTFTVQINYNDGTWTGGTVTFAWNGIFYVTQILSTTSFIYQQYGPNAATSTVGQVIPYAQIAPGHRQCVVMYEYSSGYISKPSPPFSFISNGNQYLTISNIPIGTSDVVKRHIAFTGADGANFFYLSQPATITGLTVSTSTSINDNTTTQILVDFSDNTLFTSTAIDIPGNNLFEQGVIGPCLGVLSYASRAFWYGMKNSLQNLLNLGFDGGYYSSLTFPIGWTVNTSGGILNTVGADYGFSWQITGSGGTDGQISQSAYQDAYAIPILQINTNYSFDVRLEIVTNLGTMGTVDFELFSPTSGSFGIGTVLVANLIATGSFFSGVIGTTPGTIPTDTVLRFYTHGMSAGTVITIDDFEIYPTNQASLPTFLGSYVNEPEQLDLETGVIGATTDDTSIQGGFIYRDSFLFLTQYGLHETNDLESFEPSQWRVRGVSQSCGACGPKAITTGENFSCWITSPTTQPPVGRGLYIYTGGSVFKLSQEIQPDFDSVTAAFQSSSWLVNDAVNRRMHLGLPVKGASAPNLIYVLDYREMDTAIQIAEKAPIHISFTGRMICSDLSRKWTRWSLAANCGEMMYVPGIGMKFSIGAGTGVNPSISQNTGFGNTYWFNPSKYTDDDYGQITPYYTTYFFVNHDLEQQIQVGAHRKLYKRYYCFVNGIGSFQLTPLADSLTNPWPSPPLQPLTTNQTYDLGDGLNVIADRCAFRLGSLPLMGATDNSFLVGKFIMTLMAEPIAPLRFGAI